MLSILPPEILRIIFASVDDRKTFCNILVTSRQFSQLVEPFSCAEIDFSELPLLAAAINLRSLKGLYDALQASNWRRTAYIRTFSSNFGSPVEGRTLIEKILTKTVNLKSLCLHSERLGPEITRFLESQTSLETIHIFLTEPSKAQLPVFAPTSFPNLKTLTIVPGLVLPFLRTSANVRNLRLNECEDFPPVSKQDKACMASVRVLSCFPLSAASSLASQFPKLEWLEFSNGRSDIPTLMGWSQGSHTLRGILVHRSIMPFSSELPPLFDAVPTLEFVEYKYSYKYDYMIDAGIRWYRDAPSPMSVRWLCNSHEEWLANWEKDWEPLRRSLDEQQ